MQTSLVQKLFLSLTALKKNKAPGYDIVPYEFFKNAPDSAIDVIVVLFNRMLLSGKALKNL